LPQVTLSRDGRRSVNWNNGPLPADLILHYDAKLGLYGVAAPR